MNNTELRQFSNLDINNCIEKIDTYMKIQYSENKADNWRAEKLLHTTLIFGSPKTNALTSVIIPTFNRPRELITSIRSALQQTISDINVIVVNNDVILENQIVIRQLLNSIDDSRLSYFENKHQHEMFGNWNVCLAVCPTKSMTLLNDDDFLDQNIIEDYLSSDAKDSLYVPRTRLKYGDKNPFVRNNIKKIMLLTKRIIVGNFQKYESIPLGKLIKGNTIHASLGVFFNTKKAIAIGGFMKTLYPCADTCFTSKYAIREGIVYSNQILATYVWAVNDSLKSETQIGFMLFDKSFKTYLLKTISRKSGITHSALSYLCNLSYRVKYLEYKSRDSTTWNLCKRSSLQTINRTINLFITLLAGSSYQFKIYRN